MGCSVKGAIVSGIVLAAFDIINGLATLGFYCFRFISFHFYLCPVDLDLSLCFQEKRYYTQNFALRNYIGMGEGGVTLLFDFFLIVFLLKRKPCLTQFWLLKAAGIMGINAYYISSWMIPYHNFALIDNDPEYKRIIENYQNQYVFVGAALTLYQLLLTLIFLIISCVFAFKVSQERRRSRRSLHRGPSKYRNGNASAPPLDSYHGEYHDNPTLRDSTHKLPIADSTNSIEMSHTDGHHEPTPV